MRIKFRTMWMRDNWKKSLVPSWFVAAAWAIALLFLTAAPLIIFGSAKTFVIREKSPSDSRSYRKPKQQHVTFHRREWFILPPLSTRAHNPFIKSALFVKNVVSMNSNQHQGKMQLRSLLIKVNADVKTLRKVCQKFRRRWSQFYVDRFEKHIVIFVCLLMSLYGSR